MMRPDFSRKPAQTVRMDGQTLDEDIDIEADDVDTADEEELSEDDLDEDLDEVVEIPGADEDAVVADDDDDEEDDVPTARRKTAGDDEDDEEEDDDPDDVEADLDAILKDRIAAGTDDDEEEDEVPEGTTDPDVGERVAAKSAEEFTCTGCFMIVHPRQFGRAGRLECPEGYDPCPSIKVVEQRLKSAAKK